MKENIFDKPAFKYATFRPENLLDFAARRVQVSARDAGGKFNPAPTTPYHIPYPAPD